MVAASFWDKFARMGNGVDGSRSVFRSVGFLPAWADGSGVVMERYSSADGHVCDHLARMPVEAGGHDFPGRVPGSLCANPVGA